MEENIITESPATSDEANVEQNYSYVLHGAQAACEYCSRPGRLTLPRCHGTYMHDMPIMLIDDTTPGANIKNFGFCSSMDNPDRLKAVEAVMEKVKESENLLDKFMDLRTKVSSFFGTKSKKEPDETINGYSRDVYENVTVICEPQFAVNAKWEGGTDRLMVNGKQVLNSGCEITCIKGGGRIYIIDDGQENACNEQSGGADAGNQQIV